ncbi:MAG: hypothetical protein GXY86_08795 [Firmicutes bacterium]|nr:hypothetical protein [Bacillota bacterium]
MAELTQDQIHQLFVLVEEYISIIEIKNPNQKKLQLELWEDRVKRAFPYETNVMTVSLREIAESKAREKVA